ncbi:DNA-binding response regulator [Rathayibacter rathayi]|uniref:DNA-binding response regulator n=1 Tax=Rathayibacter rathayi TaxID=33887 RepID=A0ABD6WAL4_RATRA|nr:response regulator transcription factor [Rathayibacter rathayi]AZZ49018.1 DNA-binding response regulator [Rathayibacter rathayi]MWV74128.1 response regulator [Rathayibacter rathayi NCPPB 2980 = VKM Ac-1601]PPF15153.1 DNA-binding response regulator [Rathayibacter rathayi]PPF25072.1 DNA-binding response regulator [Rathayibacter rathayi]PPF51161.1 DNA-binding response regulator [Rathayibacter rathayi]
MTDTIRLVLVDDQALFRAGIRMLLGSQPDLEVVGEASDGAEGAELVAELTPDVVLMDIRMPGVDGIESTRRILAQAQERRVEPPRILVLTTFDLDEAAARAIRAGASGFLLKDTEPGFLLASVRTVHAGTAVVAASATRELFEHFGAAGSGRETPVEFTTLTDREREIFHLAARGMSNTEIARAEFLSEATVKTHISRTLGKLGLRDRVQLVVFAYENGLVD